MFLKCWLGSLKNLRPQPQSQLKLLFGCLFNSPPPPPPPIFTNLIFHKKTTARKLVAKPKRMPVGNRSRNNKRGSSSSYTSVITTVAFTALCVVGVWMLTSNSAVPLQTTNRAATDTTDTSSSNEPQRTDTGGTSTNADLYSSREPQKTESNNKKGQPVFQDNPGDLPVDAIKSDDPKSNKEDDPKIVEENSEGLKGKESAGEKEKQEQKQNQISEESTMTQNKETEETTQESSESQSGQNVQEFLTQNSDKYRQPNVGDSEKQMSQPQDDAKRPRKGQESQDSKSYEKQQEQQRREDAGIQSSTQESQKQTSDNQQQQEDQEQQLSSDKKQQEQQKQVFQDVRAPGVQQPEHQESGKKTQDAKTETDTQAIGKISETTGNKAGESAFPDSGTSGIPKESKESKKSWSTQGAESENEKERRKDETEGKESIYGYTWQLCNVTAGSDYIPCLDNEKALSHLHTTGHYEHRERHCPEEAPDCLVPMPEGYKRSIGWPQSREKIWYHNVPHALLAKVKGHQNWVKETGEFLTFPGGGTQFIHGALHYIDFVQQAEPKIAWGKRTRVVLDVGCGVASFGGYLFERDVLTMSFAPKDEHEAQVQFALERGIPAISAVMGSQRLPFPSRVFDLVHCARCRVPWHNEGGLLLLEVNRVLRPGGYFVWSATPVYQKLEEDAQIWKAMSALTVSMCWELVTIKKDKLNSIGVAIYRKPSFNDCYDHRKKNSPPMCKNEDDPNAAWYVPLRACMHWIPVSKTERGSQWPVEWPRRLQTPPYWLNSSQMGIYGKPAPQDFARDYEHWKLVVSNSYMKALGISWSNVRNVMDMRAVYGGFAAALKDLKIWVLNVVNIDSPDTLPIIYERGLFGIYHDWCESFSTYPRTYDLLHADHLFSMLKKRCKLAPVMAEIDRIVRPGGKLIVRDESSAIGEVENLLKSLRWEVHLTFSRDHEGLLSAQKADWRPQVFAASL